MAYIPPHKRSSNGSILQKYGLGGGKVMSGQAPTTLWFSVGVIDTDGHFPFVRLHRFSWKIFHQSNKQENVILLLNTNPNHSENVELSNKVRPWVCIAQGLHHHLLSSFRCFTIAQGVHSHLLSSFRCSTDQTPPFHNFELRPAIVVRLGKLLFREPALDRFISCSTESKLKNLRKLFNTNLPTDVDTIVDGLGSNTGLVFEHTTETYIVKLSDATRPDITLTCKCRVRAQDNKLELHKVEINQLRNMIADISCLDKNLDMRLMLCTKRIATYFTVRPTPTQNDEEERSIRNIVDTAIVDEDAKGGLKWSDECLGGRHRVIEVWHTKATTYTNMSMRLKLRHADRFDFKSSTGEASTEIYFKLKGLVSELQAQCHHHVEDLLKDNLKLIWNNFLCFDHPFILDH